MLIIHTNTYYIYIHIIHYAKLSESGKGKDDMLFFRRLGFQAFKEHFDTAEWLV